MCPESQSNEKAGLLFRAFEAAREHDLPQAISFLEEYVQGNPGHAAMWGNLGMFCTELADTVEHDAEAGGADKATELREKALAAFEHRVALNPDASGYTLMGDALWALGRLEEAKAALVRALELDPRWDEAMFNLAMICREEKPEKAKRLLSQAVSIDETVALYHRELGWQLSLEGDFDAARARIEHAIELDGDDSKAWIYLGLVHEDKGELEEAERAFVKARELDPAAGTPLYHLGSLYEKQGKFTEAEADLREAAKREPWSPQVIFGLGYFLYKRGDREEAKSWLRRGLALYPHNYMARKLVSE